MLRERLERVGFGLEPVGGLPAFFRVTHQPFPISLSLEHWLGLFYLQQAATGVAPLALGALPGERILDLCAAPGGKATHLAELQQGSGTIVANDADEKRIRALIGNLYRLGHTGVLVVSGDGRTFPEGALFDRALVDAPCSGEGNPRRGKTARPDRPAFRANVGGVQRGLLRRAVELVRPGGTILYVTCTSAPEENEAVAAWAMRRLPVSVEPIDLQLPHAPGLPSHAGVSFPDDVEHAWRLTSEHMAAGCLFMIRFRREKRPREADSERRRGWRAPPFSFPASSDEGVQRSSLDRSLEWIRSSMGVAADTLNGFQWTARGGSVWMHSCRDWPVDAWTEGADPAASADPLLSQRVPRDLIALGLRAFRIESGGRLRPTNDLFRWLGDSLRDRVITLDREAILWLLDQGEIAVESALDGYVALRLDDAVLGRAWLRGGRLKSEIPRAQARLLEQALRSSAR